MYLSIFLCSLLSFAAVHAGAVKRDIAPFPTTLTGGAATYTTENVAAQTSAYVAALADSDSPPDNGNVTADAIRLVHFDGCDMRQYELIYSGWQQAQKIMAVQAIQDGNVDFNTAGALDFLGAPVLNAKRQGDMNMIFKNFATLTPAYWPFGWRLHVRCDDPELICSCGTDTRTAYTGNKDSESGLARINFCLAYFMLPSLNAVLDEELPRRTKYDMDTYRLTQGFLWTHELMHIDWVTGASGIGGNYGTNEHVTDMFIQFTDSENFMWKRKAYGATYTKILARWPQETGDYTIKNAENLAMFLTSQYVQQQLDNTYPHYPVVDVLGPDHKPTNWNTLFLYSDNGTVTVNATNPLVSDSSSLDGNSCITDPDEPYPNPMAFSSFAPASAYPSDYIASLTAELASETWAPGSATVASTGNPSQQT